MPKDRAAQERDFLINAGWGAAHRAHLAGDASNRSYARLAHPIRGGAVLMDAPTSAGEDVRPFISVTKILRDRVFSAPRILSQNVDDGFLLLEDLGDDLFARVVEASPAQEETLYAAAVDLLIELARSTPPEPGVAPAYDSPVLQNEALLALDWWRAGVLGEAAPAELRAEYSALIAQSCAAAADAREVLVLRDYHAENLLWLPARSGKSRVGLLDYQDALIGSRAYDLVSLLEDARRDVSPELAENMLERYLRAAPDLDAQAFRADYAALGAQRNLKIIGIFARLWMRDGKDRYLSYIPRVWRYLQHDLSHPSLAPLKAWVAKWLPDPTEASLRQLRESVRKASAEAVV